ncbi:hypothetical protein Tco_0459119 [Tanacetum coccineum]
MGDENPIRTLGDYSKPIHEGYKNTIELPARNNMAPLRSNTIRLVQNRCSFHGLRSEDPNQHLKDFLKLVDSLDLDELKIGKETRPTFISNFPLTRSSSSNWLECFQQDPSPLGRILLPDSLLNSFHREGRTILRNDYPDVLHIHHGESLSEQHDSVSETYFKMSLCIMS